MNKRLLNWDVFSASKIMKKYKFLKDEQCEI